jgi:SpoVK/Ycf46/Vps4 family AAA+-type ATPase
MPLVVKRGSDLLSMWLGGTEKNIANAFREAESEGAVLMIDEVDSFLQDRRGAQRTWEITGVNEMLTNLEAFQGILIATTNLVDSLDQAALRRFDLKLCLDYLQPSQAEALLQRCCQKLQLPTPSQQVLARVRALNKLTPGDFAAVLRQGRFHRISDASELVARLQTDCALKGNGDRPIGFVH